MLSDPALTSALIIRFLRVIRTYMYTSYAFADLTSALHRKIRHLNLRDYGLRNVAYCLQCGEEDAYRSALQPETATASGQLPTLSES